MTIVFGFPEQGKGAVIMTNGDGGDKLYREILFSLATEYDWPRRPQIGT